MRSVVSASLIAIMLAVLSCGVDDVVGPTSPESCIDYSSYLRLSGDVLTPESYDVSVAGSYAYVAQGGSGMMVIDISNPDAPRVVGGVNTPGTALDVVVAGAHAYVADGASGLQVIDISNPASPFILSTLDTPDAAVGVAVTGSYALVADRNAGLQFIDISNPVAPTIAGSID